jgi:hypothetical protein
MLNFVLGAAAFGSAGFIFWLLLPKGGKPSPIAGSKLEAYWVVGLIAIIGLGIGMFIEGAITMSSKR